MEVLCPAMKSWSQDRFLPTKILWFSADSDGFIATAQVER